MNNNSLGFQARSHETENTIRVFTLPVYVVLFAILTTAMSLIISHYRLMWIDEFLVLNQDNVPNLRQLIQIERNYPLSLDPLTFHLFAHAAMQVFGPVAFAIRLPAFSGYLLMQICLFLFLRRIASERAAFFGMVFPSLLYTSYFAVDGRPYGLQLGLCSLALLSWQSACRSRGSRIVALITLALSLALMVNTHYYGPLLLIPFYAAELYRTFEQRTLDVPICGAIAVGTASLAFFFPFLKAAAAFREHYLEMSAGPKFVPTAYSSLLVFPNGSGGIGRILFLAVLACSLLWSLYRLVGHPSKRISKPELVIIVMLTAIPIFGYLLALFVTHSIEVRYVLATTLGIALLEAVAIEPFLASTRICRIVIGLMLFIVVAHSIQRTNYERRSRQIVLSGLILSPAIKAELIASPSKLLYIQDLEKFFMARFYEPDSDIRSRLALVYSRDKELEVLHHDTYWLNATHLSKFTDVKTVTYESLQMVPGSQVFILLHDRYQWIDKPLADSHATSRPLGPAFSADAVTISFSQGK